MREKRETEVYTIMAVASIPYAKIQSLAYGQHVSKSCGSKVLSRPNAKRVNVHDNCHQSNFYFENIFINPATTYTVIFYQSRFTYTVIFSSTWPPLTL